MYKITDSKLSVLYASSNHVVNSFSVPRSCLFASTFRNMVWQAKMDQIPSQRVEPLAKEGEGVAIPAKPFSLPRTRMR